MSENRTRDDETRDNASVWWDDEWDGGTGRWVYRASGLGNCIGGLVRMRMGVDGEEAPAWMQEKWDQGRTHEQTVLDGIVGYALLDEDELRGLGLTVDAFGQAELEVKIPGGPVVVCHPDGLAWDMNMNLVVVEAKALSEGYAKTVAKELPAFYAWQTSVEVAGLRKLGVTEVLWVTGIKNETGDKITHVEQKIIQPPYGTADIIKRVREVERLATNGEVPFCEFRQYPCAFWLDHDVDNDPLWKDVVEEVVDAEVEQELHVAVMEYEAMKVGEKECAADKKKAANKIAEIADSLGVHGGKLKTSQYVVTDVVQQRKGAVVVEQVFRELGFDEGLLTDEVLDKCRGTFETRYPTVKKLKKDEG